MYIHIYIYIYICPSQEGCGRGGPDSVGKRAPANVSGLAPERKDPSGTASQDSRKKFAAELARALSDDVTARWSPPASLLASLQNAPSKSRLPAPRADASDASPQAARRALQVVSAAYQACGRDASLCDFSPTS